MYLRTILLGIAALATYAMRANNIQVSNTTLVDNTGSTVKIQFDVSWENSWRGGPVANWDAAWVFAKCKLSNGQWQHIRLASSGHTVPTGTSMDLGLVDPAGVYNATTNPVVGAFLYRNTNGYGALTASAVQLFWDHAAQGVISLVDVVELRVFAIEMVYVNGGAYYLGTGSGGFEGGSFYTAPNNTTTFPITSEAAINVGTTAGYLYYAGGSGTSGDQTGPLPAAFPKGFNPFYCMKYEVSQQGYVDFLNTLTYTQQVARTANAPNAAPGTAALITGNLNRNAIVIMTSGALVNVPASYACNLNGNGVYGEPDDGADIACNYLSIGDLAAYLDWSALRPMTELEYEKACRGPVTPLPTEFPWGTTARATSQYAYTNGGTNTEGISVNYATNAGNISSVFTANNFGGPSRVGIFAAHPNNSGRETSGASFYGIMEMAGNVTERPISMGSPQGRAYTGAHGNGILSTAGEADPTNWANAIAVTGFRGGSWLSNSAVRYMVSDRSEISWARTARYLDSGGRGVRKSP